MFEDVTADWTWINDAADRFERAWKAGEQPRIEDYLAEVKDESRWPRVLDELLRVEIELRRKDGEQPTPEEYHERFPAEDTIVAVVFCDDRKARRSGVDCESNEPRVSVTGNFDRSLIRDMLNGLAGTTGSGPRVLLRDTESEPATPVVRPSTPEMPEESGRYQLLGEIGHGGMRAVLKGRDPDLGRDLAVKILLAEHQNSPDLVRRFIEEAQIGGQLQHPGIVPVYELGKFSDGRPYFTMKLIKGRTLAALLRERASPAHELPRFLGIFEQVCQTMAYAHSRGVIHRDLKPSNIMVGAFGEVRVMDWGLAKVLPQGGTADEAEPDVDAAARSAIATIRSGSRNNDSVDAVLGTPAYMAPEQAGGDVDSIDERADVFGLGSILCEILTGRPAYTGSSSDAIYRKARRCDTADAQRRLTRCGADAELVALAVACLAAAAEERPRHAGTLAARMTAYLAGVQNRLRAAELARAAEEARAEEAQATAAAAERARAAEEARADEARAAAVAAKLFAQAERKARQRTVGMAASILIAGTLGAGGWTWIERDRAARITARSAQVSTALREATGLRGQALGAAGGDLVAWTKALAAAQKAHELIDPGLSVSLRSEVESLLTTVTRDNEAAVAAARSAESNRVLTNKLVDIRSAKTDDPDGSISDGNYAATFREAGIDVAALSPSEVGAQIKARHASVAASLVAALDDWSSVRRSRRHDRPGALRLSEVAIAADPDPWRVDLRRALDLEDRSARAKALRDLAASTKPEEAPAVDLHLLGMALSEVGEPKAAEEVLREGRRGFPDDVWLNYDLAHLLQGLSRGDEALRYYSIARALRPETAHDLAHLLDATGESVEAIAAFKELVRLRPDDGRHWFCYGCLLKERGGRLGSIKVIKKGAAILQETVRLKPNDAAVHYMLGGNLHDQGKLDEAIAEYRETIRLSPSYVDAHNNLGNVLRDQGKWEEGIAEYREAIRIKPDHSRAYTNLGNALVKAGKRDEAIAKYREAIRIDPLDALTHNNLGLALAAQKKYDEAITEYNLSMRLKPDYANLHVGLGDLLRGQGKIEEANAEYKEAIRLEPNNPVVHYNLGCALLAQKKYEEAIAEYHDAIRLQPDLAEAHDGLGFVLRNQGRLEDAIASYNEAIRLKPDLAGAYANLGALLCDDKRDYDGAVTAFRRAIRINPTDGPTHCDLGNALMGQKKLAEAIAEYREAIRLEPDHASAHNNLGCALRDQDKLDEAISEWQTAIRVKPDHVSAHFNLASALRRQGKLEAAVAEYKTAIQDNPDSAELHHGLGHALSDQRKVVQAIAEFREAIRIKPDYAEAYKDVGNVLREQGKPQEAIAEYRKAIGIEPDDAGTYNSLGNALNDLEKLEEAIVEFKSAIRIDPNNADPHNGLGNSLRAQGKLDEAIAEYRAAIQIKPNYELPHSNLGNALRDQGKLEDAIAEFTTAIRLKPDLATAHSSLGNALRDQGKLDEAVTECRTAISLKPDHAEAHNNLGNALSDQRKLDDAIVEYRTAIRLKPDHALAHNNLGNSLRGQGKLGDAIVEYRTAVRLKPEDPTAHSNLGAALHGQGKWEEAIAEYREAIRLKPDHAWAHNNLAWALVVSPSRARKEYDDGLLHALKAVELAKLGENLFGTLALAEYRCGHLAESLAASERSMALRKGMFAYDWFFMAMAHSQKGDKDESRKWFDKAVKWTKENQPKNSELRKFWTEAAELLGQPGPGVAAAPKADTPR